MKLPASSRRIFVWSWITFLLALTACGGGGGSAKSSSSTPSTPSSGTLTFSTTSMDFGNVTLGSPKTLGLSMSNTGGAALTVSQLQSTTGDFAITGISLPLTLNPQQTASGTITFNPSASGLISGNINALGATGTLATVSLRGTGLQPASHSVALSWTISSSPATVGYNIYRSTISGGPYTKIGNSNTSNFTDIGVQAGKKYFYVVTAIDGANVESAASSEVSASVPTP